MTRVAFCGRAGSLIMTERELFLNLLELEPTRRPAYLDAACGADGALRQRLERLLKAHEETKGFLERPAHDLDAVATAVHENLRRLAGTDNWVGPYHLLEQVGAGGMGVIYKASHTEMNRTVAVKMILAGPHALAQDLARFRVEAGAVRELRHPNIVEIYEVGTHEGLPYLVMEFMDLGNLTQALKGTSLPPPLAAELVEVLARAIHAVHQLGIIHRDLKPANVLLATPAASPAPLPAVVKRIGVPKITDFGLAKRLGQEIGNTRSGAVMGTPSYMAPEQAEGRSRHVGPAADVYALGAILYEVLTGRPPFQGATMMEVLDQVRNQEPVSPSKIVPNMPRDVVTICLRALAKEPHNRYVSAEALADDLRHFLSAERVCARPVTWRERTWRWCRRNPLLAGMTAGVSVLLTVLLLALWVGHLLRQSRDSALAAQQRAEESDAKTHDALAQLEQAQREIKARSFLARAAAIRTRGQMGQRFACLAELRQALQLDPSPELRAEIRTEAIAALALPDMEIAREWDAYPPGDAILAFDGSLERYVRVDQQGNAVVCRLTPEGEQVLGRIAALPKLRLIGPLLSRSGRWLLIWQGPQFRVWDLDQPEPKLMLQEKATYVQWSVALHPDAPRLAVGHHDHTVSVWDLETGQRLRQLKLNTLPGPLAFNPKPGDQRLAVVCGGVVRLFEVSNGIEHPPLRPGPGVTWIEGLDWHPGGRRLAIGGNDQRIHLWDADTAAAVTPPWEGHTTAPIFPVFNPAGDRVVSTDWNGQPRLWDAVTGRLLFTGSGLGLGQLFNRAGSLLGHARSGIKVRQYRVAAGHELRVLRRPRAGADDSLDSPHLDADGQVLAAAANGHFCFFHLATGEELASVRWPTKTLSRPLGFLRGQGWLTGSLGDQVRLWPMRRDPAQPDVVRVGPPQRLAPCGFERAASSADGQVLAVPNGNAGAVVLHRGAPSQRLILAPQHDVRHVAVSSDGRWVVTCSHWPDLQSRHIRIWDATTGRHAHDLPLGNGSAADFSPDGKWLVTATSGEGSKLWEVGTWRLVRDLGSGSFAFSPDSRLLAMGDPIGTIRLVEVTSGHEVARLTFPEPAHYSPACFSPDGAHLLAMRGDLKAIYVWDLRLVRHELQALDLDWEAPPYAAMSKEFARPLRLIVEGGATP
jgi:serine/threonine protein kinase/WD40 repeat protein